MEIRQVAPPLQIEGLKGDDAIRKIAIYTEAQVNRMQREIYTLRQFLEPAIVNNKNCPEQEFNPLE